MITVVEYLVIAIVIGAIIFGLAVVVFGRGEQMAALPARTSPSELPAEGIRGNHVREVRFGLALRGYRMSDVDWTLERLADEIDLLRSQLPDRDAAASTPERSLIAPDAPDSSDADPTAVGQTGVVDDSLDWQWDRSAADSSAAWPMVPPAPAGVFGSEHDAASNHRERHE